MIPLSVLEISALDCFCDEDEEELGILVVGYTLWCPQPRSQGQVSLNWDCQNVWRVWKQCLEINISCKFYSFSIEQLFHALSFIKHFIIISRFVFYKTFHHYFTSYIYCLFWKKEILRPHDIWDIRKFETQGENYFHWEEFFYFWFFFFVVIFCVLNCSYFWNYNIFVTL